MYVSTNHRKPIHDTKLHCEKRPVCRWDDDDSHICGSWRKRKKEGEGKGSICEQWWELPEETTVENGEARSEVRSDPELDIMLRKVPHTTFFKVNTRGKSKIGANAIRSNPANEVVEGQIQKNKRTRTSRRRFPRKEVFRGRNVQRFGLGFGLGFGFWFVFGG
jgi:hypothetical protein